MTPENMERQLKMPRTGRPCGARMIDGPCLFPGLEPTGRCFRHGAAAQRGPKGRQPRPTKRQRRATLKRVAKLLQEMGVIPPAEELRKAEAKAKEITALMDEALSGTHALVDLTYAGVADEVDRLLGPHAGVDLELF